jgi:hypothetical protein
MATRMLRSFLNGCEFRKLRRVGRRFGRHFCDNFTAIENRNRDTNHFTERVWPPKRLFSFSGTVAGRLRGVAADLADEQRNFSVQ